MQGYIRRPSDLTTCVKLLTKVWKPCYSSLSTASRWMHSSIEARADSGDILSLKWLLLLSHWPGDAWLSLRGDCSLSGCAWPALRRRTSHENHPLGFFGSSQPNSRIWNNWQWKFVRDKLEARKKKKNLTWGNLQILCIRVPLLFSFSFPPFFPPSLHHLYFHFLLPSSLSLPFDFSLIFVSFSWRRSVVKPFVYSFNRQ